MTIQDTFLWHKAHHPFLNTEDAVKLVFQSMMGCGHLLGEEAAVTAYINEELRGQGSGAPARLPEPCGNYVRMDLPYWVSLGLPPEWLARMMILTAEENPPADTIDYLNALRSGTGCDLRDQQGKPVSPERMLDLAAELLNARQLPSHSEGYRASEKPCYRIVSAELAALVPVLTRIRTLMDRQPAMIAIDGCCGSGKSTMAERLKRIVGGVIVHMDDFFTPHPMKTPERLAQPGGNADIERFAREVIEPLKKTGCAAYRPYLCHADDYGEPIELRHPAIVICEGSYSLHPALGDPYDLRIFLRISAQEQERRITARNGSAMWQNFVNRWIPLEEAYFSAFSLPDERCLVYVDGQNSEGML